MVAPEAPHLALHAALLVGSPLAGLAEERLIEVVGAQRHEAVGFDPPAAAQDLDHGGLEVVVADFGRYAAEEGEGVGVALQERLLGLVGEGLHIGGAGVREPHQEELGLDQLSSHPNLRLAPVDLGLRAGIVGLGDVALDPQAELSPAGGDVLAHGSLGDPCALLDDQPLPDALGGVALLGRRLPVALEPLVDQVVVGAEDRRRPPRGLLARRWQRRLQGLAHRSTVDPMPPRELADREPLPITVTANLLEQLHSGSHPVCDLRPRLSTSRKASVAIGRGGAK